MAECPGVLGHVGFFCNDPPGNSPIFGYSLNESHGSSSAFDYGPRRADQVWLGRRISAGAVQAGRVVLRNQWATRARLPANVPENGDHLGLVRGVVRRAGVHRRKLVAGPVGDDFAGAFDGGHRVQRSARRRAPCVLVSTVGQQAHGDVAGPAGRQFLRLEQEAQRGASQFFEYHGPR